MSDIVLLFFGGIAAFVVLITVFSYKPDTNKEDK